MHTGKTTVDNKPWVVLNHVLHGVRELQTFEPQNRKFYFHAGFNLVDKKTLTTTTSRLQQQQIQQPVCILEQQQQ